MDIPPDNVEKNRVPPRHMAENCNPEMAEYDKMGRFQHVYGYPGDAVGRIKYLGLLTQ